MAPGWWCTRRFPIGRPVRVLVNHSPSRCRRRTVPALETQDGLAADGGAAWRTASRIAAAVRVAATAPRIVSDHEAAGPGAAGEPAPEARQKTMSPSKGVKAGSTARAIPALAMR